MPKKMRLCVYSIGSIAAVYSLLFFATIRDFAKTDYYWPCAAAAVISTLIVLFAANLLAEHI